VSNSGAIEEIIDQLEEERKLAKATNDFKSSKLFEKIDFVKYVEQVFNIKY